MALTRKFLSALGIETEKVDEIISAHVETVDQIKAERDKYKADAEKLPTIQQELQDLKKNVEENGKEAYKVKYDALKEEFNTFKTDIANKEIKAKKENAYRNLLKNAGVSEKRLDAVVKVSDIDSIELDDQGNIKDADKLTASIKEEWSDFIQTTHTEGANTATPPTSNNSPAKRTKKDIMEIKDTTERQNAWAEFLTQSQKG